MDNQPADVNDHQSAPISGTQTENTQASGLATPSGTSGPSMTNADMPKADMPKADMPKADKVANSGAPKEVSSNQTVPKVTNQGLNNESAMAGYGMPSGMPPASDPAKSVTLPGPASGAKPKRGMPSGGDRSFDYTQSYNDIEKSGYCSSTTSSIFEPRDVELAANLLNKNISCGTNPRLSLHFKNELKSNLPTYGHQELLSNFMDRTLRRFSIHSQGGRLFNSPSVSMNNLVSDGEDSSGVFPIKTKVKRSKLVRLENYDSDDSISTMKTNADE